MRTAAALVILVASASLAACNLLVGAPVPGSTDAPDATLDASGEEAATPPVDVGGDAPDAGDGGPSCVDLCTPGSTRCDDAGVTSCTLTPGSCAYWAPAVECPAHETCSTSGVSAFCCDGCCGPGSGAACGTTSCAGDGGDGIDNCGPAFAESCCSTELVQAGAFFRDYDGIKNTSKTFPAQISAFAFDRFEVTVGRFRRFVDAWEAGWRPQAGSGTHAHLNGGSGLVDSSGDGGAFETGWDVAWATNLAQDEAGWTSNLQCDPLRQTWTSIVSTAETDPINCVTWFEAYAFCIWDGGFLPSEAEWDYAAAGGPAPEGQRAYPWSVPSESTAIDCSYANCSVCDPDIVAPVGRDSPKGDGRWGQADLTGNVWEWTLDFTAKYVVPCTDCAFLHDASFGRTIRGGDWMYPPEQLYVSLRSPGNAPTVRYPRDGIRCARAP
jgi:sulfatase modifying factor 1